MNDITSVAIIGSGAVGSYYGARLAQKGDAKVSFLMRRDLEAVRQAGLQVYSSDGDFHLSPVRALASTQEIGPVDLVVIALKTTSNGAIPTLLPPVLHEQTCILTLQNGLGNEAYLHRLFPHQPILGGLCFVCINRGEPGVIHHLSHGRIEMGEFTETGSVDLVHELFESAGIDTRLSRDLEHSRWRKLIWNVPFNGLAIAEGGLHTEAILSDPARTDRVRSLMHEIIEAAAALGHEISQEFAEENITNTRKMGPYRPSSLIDFETGSAVEIESIWGEPLRQARQAGVDTPELERLYFEITKAVESR